MRARALRGVVVLASVIALAPAHAGGLAIVGTELRDNGDHDGYADTNETVEVWLTVRNTTNQPLTGVTVSLSTTSVGVVCVLDGAAAIGDLAPGAEVRAAEPLVFHVAGSQDRTALGLTPVSDLSVSFDVGVAAGTAAPAAYPSRLVFDLDLDVGGGGAPTAVTENFESGGFGIFGVQNLDFGLHHDVSWEQNNSYPRRCQYHSPLCSAICQGLAAQCSLGGTTAAADGVWWRIDGPELSGGGRSFTGTHSLYFGEPLGPELGYTTPAGVMEAVATTAPIHFASGRLCSNAAATACLDDTGCPPGGSCAATTPTLSFMHQASLLDNRTITNIPAGDPGQALDRGVVAVQLSDAAGAAIGPWMRLEPSVNVYDAMATPIFGNCSFDPIDDGSDEEDLYPPFLPVGDHARRGPSSTCADERVFTFVGSTEGAYNPAAVGRTDGPGLAGFAGPGTWIETRYDLSRFRGRYVRLRFLASTTRVGTSTTYEAWAGLNPHPGDDGWWIDDVTISWTATSPGTLSNDNHPNSGMTLDGDFDGFHDACDNCLGVANSSQVDFDGDDAGDACDSCTDGDADGFGNPGFPASTCAVDNCPLVADPTQSDVDFDSVGDLCDNCPASSNGNQANGDGDPAGDACDCAPGNFRTYPGAIEWNDNQDNNCPGDVDFGIKDEISGTIGFFDPAIKGRLSWPAQTGASTYVVGRSLAVSVSSPGIFCALVPQTATNLVTTTPPPGFIQFYIVRSQTQYVGSLGRTSAGVERTVVTCN